MEPTLTTVLPEKTKAVGTLVYEAFRDIAERHNFDPAFESPELARLIVRLLAQAEGYESYLLEEGGRPLACNFGDERDEVIGVGPVAVAVGQQGRGLGRQVMEALLERAEQGGFASVRLLQAAYNIQSFALYQRLGFEVKDTLALLLGRPLVEPVDDLPLEESDLPEPLVILADDFIRHGYDLRRLVHVIAATGVFQLDSRADPQIASHEITPQHDQHWAVFPLTRLRSEQVVGAVLQSASLQTIDYDSHIIVRFLRALGQNEFIERYGDAGEAEMEEDGGTIPQRLLLMNGELVKDRTKDNLVSNAATRIAMLAPDSATAVEVAYLAVLSRRPTTAELEHFVARLDEVGDRKEHLEDLYWTLINSTEFSWNH